MRVQLAYGRTGLPMEVPNDAVMLSARHIPGLKDETAWLKESLRAPIHSLPLRELVQPGDTVTIVHTDITRATPNERILPVLLDELEQAGVRKKNIILLNALGTHRPQTETELRRLLGDGIVDNYRCLQHDAWDDANLVLLGNTSFGHPVRLNRFYVEASVRILTGFIEPHFFAGFSGGPKGVLPSIAGYESVLNNHGREMIAHPKATWGVTSGNPIWEEMREAALLAPPTFLLNVAMNDSRQITAIFAGEMLQAHAAGRAFVGDCAIIPVDQPFDIVVTTNSGYPLDQNLYQSIKGVSAAARVVRPGGAILLAAECSDGLPAYGGYAQLLKQGGSPQGILDLLASPGFHAHDQWNVQIQAQIQLHAQVYVYATGLTEEEIQEALFIPVHDLAESLKMLQSQFGPRICILPQGPLCIPQVLS
jgi:nickel-dependent lactate racemase